MSTPKKGTIAWYRKEHKAISADVYDFKWKATQQTRGGLVHKSNYAPLGRVPAVVKSDKGARRKYETAHDTLTATGYAGLSKKKRKAYRPPYGVPERYTYYLALDGAALPKRTVKKPAKKKKRAVTLDEAMGKAMRFA